jgi:hypothetical protein
VHDPAQAIVYAKELAKYAEEAKEDLLIVMRVYFEKPRTTVGWKGLINDPDMNGTFQINRGLKMARKLMLDITELGLPTAGEFLGTWTVKMANWRACRCRRLALSAGRAGTGSVTFIGPAKFRRCCRTLLTLFSQMSSRPSSSPTSRRGVPSVRAPPSRRSTVSSPRLCPCRSASRTAL